jgi:hypothetical protein
MTDKDILEKWINDAELEGKKVALVEGLQPDESFWRDVFEFYTKEKISLDFPFAEKAGKTSKSSLGPYYELLAEFSGRFIICRDSDVEHLYDNEKKALFETPYLFHTHAYSIENLKCVPKNLHKICLEITSEAFDFKDFMSKYSNITYRFLIIFLWLKEEADVLIKIKKEQKEKDYSITQNKIQVLSQLWEESKVRTLLKYDKMINPITNLNVYWQDLQQKITDYEDKVKAELMRGGVFSNTQEIELKLTNCEQKYNSMLSKNETYYYLNGHILFDNVVVPLFKKVREALVLIRKGKLQGQLQSEYANKVHSIDIHTRLGISYKESLYSPSTTCVMLEKIDADIHKSFAI